MTIQNTIYKDNDILNYKIYLVYNYLSFKAFYLKDNANGNKLRNVSLI